MSVAGTAGDRTLSGVKAGVLGKGSSEAVNGAQLFATNANVETNAGNISANGEKIATNAANIASNKATIAVNTSDIDTNKTHIAVNAAGIKSAADNIGNMASSLGGGASVDANGKFVAPSYSVQGLKVKTVGGALTALNDGVDTNKTSIANITKDIHSGNVGLVKQDAENLALTVAAGTGGSTMSVAGTAGDRTLSGVKAGVLGKGSSEAVNGAQLFATNTNVESNTTAIAKIANDVNTGSMGLVKQDAESLALTVAAGTGGSTMSVAGTAGDRTLSGVKAGVLGKGSSEAVNGAQLFAT